MSEVLINSADDMDWLRSVHLHRLPPKYKAALIRGNEDCPDEIRVYARRDPKITDKPLTYVRYGHCQYRLKRK